MSYLTKRLTTGHILSHIKKSIMVDFAISLGPIYAKKRLINSKICFFSEKVPFNGCKWPTFDNYNASIKCSIQSHEFKVVFTTCGSFWTNLQTRHKLTNY